MFGGVALFGAATLVLGATASFAVALGALFLLGVGDMVSVYIRHLLVQFETPDEIRGRVSAVNSVFIGASNELGEFESGLTAGWFGLVRAILLGGAATLAVTGIWAWRVPGAVAHGPLPAPRQGQAERPGRLSAMLAALPDLLHPLRARAPRDGDADFLARLYASTRMDLHSATADPAFVASLVAMQQRLQAAGYRAGFPGAATCCSNRTARRAGASSSTPAPTALRLVDIALLPASARPRAGQPHPARAASAARPRHALAADAGGAPRNPHARRLYLALGFRSLSTKCGIRTDDVE